MPAKCPDEVPFEKYRRYADLVAPPAQCEPCPCPPSEGTCSGLSPAIEVRAGTCAENGAPSLSFDGPAGWDGSCTSTNALPAGMQCGDEPCAQSVWTAPLPGPTSESCPVTSVQPAFTKPKAEWLTAGLACEVKELDGACDPDEKRCVRELPYPWLLCVALKGENACPGNYTYAKFLMYGEEPIDERGCNACACGGDPMGGACLASMKLYNDAACTLQFIEQPISSVADECENVFPAGRALGAKSITDLAYMPGTCAATGGEPRGEVKVDPTDAVTFCCLAPFDLPS